MKAAAIIAAAGEGLRMKSSTRKQYLILEQKPVLIRSLQLFVEHEAVEQIVVVIPPGDHQEVRSMLEAYWPDQNIALVTGGDSRQESVSLGLKVISQKSGLICIHDAARPLVSKKLLESLLAEAKKHGAAVPVLPLSDTIKEIGPEEFVLSTPSRENLRRVQTPQVFLQEIIFEAYKHAARNNFLATDDASLVERTGGFVKMVPGEINNLKITSPEDLALASIILRGVEDS
ncbi:MAG: 2-C-methyl-D-erythritol 4-phosphate cytidylyltransferase [Bacillota bacterium]